MPQTSGMSLYMAALEHEERPGAVYGGDAAEPNPRIGLAAASRSWAERPGSGGELAEEVEANSLRR